jgi:1-acyl-sn-glycerol-3-phosphate acyltransferase
MRIIQVIKGIWFYLMFAIGVIFSILYLLPLKWLDRRSIISGWQSFFWGQWIRITAKLKFELIGLEHLKQVDGCVFVMNHQSVLDHVLIACLPRRLSTIAKKELFYIPFFGQLLRLANIKPVERGTNRAKNSIKQASEVMRDSLVSYAIYPEGTRSRDGSLARFKTGAFRLAIDIGLPIVVLTIINTGKALSPSSFLRFDGSVTSKLIVSEEVIETKNLTFEDVNGLMEKYHKHLAYGLMTIFNLIMGYSKIVFSPRGT